MISDKMQDAINKQINAEIYSSYLYLSMSAYFESQNLKGCANWMRVQAQEELAHTMKFYHHLIERGGAVTLTAIEGPPKTWDSPLAAFENAYKHEQKVTSLIHGLVDLAISEKDHASNNFLQWYVKEQVEEEASADETVQRLRLIGDSGNGIFMVDHELSKRTFNPPAKS